jgi:hypothetical protein
MQNFDNCSNRVSVQKIMGCTRDINIDTQKYIDNCLARKVYRDGETHNVGDEYLFHTALEKQKSVKLSPISARTFASRDSSVPVKPRPLDGRAVRERMGRSRDSGVPERGTAADERRGRKRGG